MSGDGFKSSLVLCLNCSESNISIKIFVLDLNDRANINERFCTARATENKTAFPKHIFVLLT